MDPILLFCLTLWKPKQKLRYKKQIFSRHYHFLIDCFSKALSSEYNNTGFANFIDEWSHCDFCFTNFGVILEYLESSITTKKAIFRLSNKWSWHVYTIVMDTRSSCGGPLTWKAQIHDGGHPINFDRNLPSSYLVVQYNSLISMI